MSRRLALILSLLLAAAVLTTAVVALSITDTRRPGEGTQHADRVTSCRVMFPQDEARAAKCISNLP